MKSPRVFLIDGNVYIILDTIEKAEDGTCLEAMLKASAIVGVQEVEGKNNCLVYYEGSDEPFGVAHAIKEIIHLMQGKEL